MTTATFPGNGNYYAQLDAWRSGFTVYCRLTVVKTSGSGYWTTTPQGFQSRIGDQYNNGTWTYDFRNYGSKIVVEWSRTFGGPGNVTVGANATMDGFGTAGPGDITVNIPPNAPAAPSLTSVVRNSDTSQTINWTDNASGSAPYKSVQVQRQMYNGSWSSFGGIVTDTTKRTSSGSRSYNDTSTVANRIYCYRIKAANGAGESYSGNSVWIFTTPAAPTGVTATKQASGDIIISWVKGTPHSEIVSNVDYSTNGGASWTSLATGIASGTTSVTHTSPPAVASLIYRVRHTIETAASGALGEGLTSAYGQSNAVQLTAPPNPPSSLAPNGVTFNAATARTFTWAHNSVDSSAQTAYELRYRIGAGAWTTTGQVASSAQQRVIAASTFTNGNSYEWQVRTWGAHVNPSDWSPTATFANSAPPSATITAPSTTLAQALVTVTWTYSDPESTAQSAWEAVLLKEGTTLESRSGSGAATSAAFTTRLVDATEYQVQVRVRDGSALWSAWDQKTFTTSFPSPAIPLISVAWDINMGIAGITVNNPDVGIAVINNKVMRSTDEGSTWVEVASTPPNGTGFDKTVPLNASVMYKVIAWTDLPSSASSMSTLITTTASYGYWSAGSDLEYSFGMRANYQKPPQYGVEKSLAQKTLHYFAGRTKPVEYSGTATTVAGSVEFATRDLDEWAQVDRMSTISGPHLLRFTNGMVVKCSIEPVSITKINKLWHQISFSFQEVD